MCQVFIFISKHYQDFQDFITCDVIDMDKCHILLGRPWQYDVDAIHRRRENIYVFTLKGKRVAMRLIPLTIRSTKKRVPSLVYPRN